MTTATAAVPERRDWLAALREMSGRNQQALANDLNLSVKAISKWERGLSTPRPEHRPALAAVLGITVPELARKLELPYAPAPDQVADGNGFAQTKDRLSLFVRAEQTAQAILTLETHAFPALAQVRRYAEEVERSGHRGHTAEEVDGRVLRRMKRAAVLGTGAQYVALIAAHLLDATVGGHAVMAEQLAHLLDLADRPNVTVLIIDAEHLFTAAGPFTLVAQDSDAPDTAAEAGHGGPRYAEDYTVDDRVALFEHLRSRARSPEASREAIAKSADRFAALAKKTTTKGTV